MAVVSLHGVKKTYDKLEVIHGIDIDIADGEFVVIVGPSGCGKSTLLRMVAGLERITGGEAKIGPRVVNDLEPKDRDIAMVFQNYALYPHMSVYENMAYGLKIRKLSKTDIDTRVRKAAKVLELGALLERKPRVQMRLEIKRLQRELKVTSIYVTHDQVEAMTLADRLIVMNAGVAEQIGTPMDVYDKPATMFVAGFIGSPAMNFLSGKVADSRQSIDLVGTGSIRFSLPLNGPTTAAPGAPVSVGLRPEHLVPYANGPLELEIDMAEPLGADTLLHGRVGEARELVTVRQPGHVLAKPGEKRRFNIDAKHLHLFDQSGKRIAGA
jgi:sn-glycerol 3-phosphate transport system ATP-binding protein